MAGGEKVPLVFFPRFTTLTSATTFWTTPIDMIEFENFSLTSLPRASFRHQSSDNG